MPFNPNIQHVFVLMLENRSFDHMLAFSGIPGIEVATTNSFNEFPDGVKFNAGPGATNTMQFDPGHEFIDVLEQLTKSKVFNPDGSYPARNNSGFVQNYATTVSPGEGGAKDHFEIIMKGYGPEQVPVINQLAREFAVCDHWHASMPGPTWPNRFFVHAASSGGLDHSPTVLETALLETIKGFQFEHGTIFDRLRDAGISFRIYRGGSNPLIGSIPIAAGLKGITLGACRSYDHFTSDLSGDYPFAYTFIEPNYGNIINSSFAGGKSQHPRDDIRGGEALIKEVYETIRKNNTLWEKSLLIITYDEHGGFYDHVPPPNAVPPGDKTLHPRNKQKSFLFDCLGVRVPALVISPYTPKGLVSKKNYDHSCVPATVKEIFKLPDFLTDRDAAALSLSELAALDKPRTDCPMELVAVAGELSVSEKLVTPQDSGGTVPDSAPVDGGNLPGFLHVIMKTDAEENEKAGMTHESFLLEWAPKINTRGQCRDYMEAVLKKMGE
jgi:phospholipase C